MGHGASVLVLGDSGWVRGTTLRQDSSDQRGRSTSEAFQITLLSLYHASKRVSSGSPKDTPYSKILPTDGRIPGSSA
jgi:hypothetical protein